MSVSSGVSEQREVKLPVPRERLPRHVAVIMDGNGRWAQSQGLLRIEGHRRGAETVRKVATRCGELGLERLTLFCLSSENWKRPAEELGFLMEMLSIYLRKELDFLREHNVRLETIGRLERLPEKVQKDLAQAKALLESNTGMSLCLAINYGGRAEIVDAVREISAKVGEGQLEVDAIDEELVARHLQTRGMTDPDLLVRTAGEMRVSNFLLWQISYAELWVTEKTWPEFDVSDFDQALIDYAGRERRFGGLNQGGKQTC